MFEFNMKYSFKALALVCYAFAAVMVNSSCSGPKVQADADVFASAEDVRLMVGYKDMIDFASGDLQYSVNNAKHIYRAGVTSVQRDEAEKQNVQTVQQYYVLNTEEPLGKAEEQVKGVLTLCSPTISSGIRTYKIEDARIIKATDKQVWIWDSTLHLGVVVRLSE